MRLTNGIRLFYDIPSTVRHAEFVLLLSDFLLIAAPVYFVAAIPYRESPGVEAFLLGLWAIVPRSMARYVGWLGRPQGTLHSTTLSAVFILMTAGLVLAGWELLYQSAPYAVPLGLGTALVVILAWAGNFLLFQPRAYRIVDFLTGGVILLGLFEHKPTAWLWVPAYFVALAFSATTRHFLYDVYNHAPSRWINLQNLRVLSTSGTLLAVGSFLGTAVLFNGAISFPETPAEAPTNVAKRRPDRLVAWPEAPPGTRNEAQGGFVRQSLDMKPADDDEDRGRLGPRRKFSYRGDLSKLARRPNNTTPIFTVSGPMASDAPKDGDPALAWPPPEDARGRILHRAVTFSVFDPENHSWGEGALRDDAWPDDQTLIVDPSLENADVLFLTYVVKRRVFPSFVSLFRTRSYRSLTPSHYRQNDAGVVIPSKPGLASGDTYFAFARPTLSNSAPTDVVPGSYPQDPATLEIPPDAELGFSLTEVADRVFADSGDPVAALRAYFEREGFSYAKYRFWVTSGNVLEDFLLKQKAGNCSYYATAAALLLRAKGVSTRVGAGFAGGRWRPDLEELWLEYGMLHAWVEVYYPQRGWYPIDPTLWVPFNALGNPPESDDSDSSSAGQDLDSNAQPNFFDAKSRQKPTSSIDAVGNAGRGDRSTVGSKNDREQQAEPLPVEQSEEELGDWIDFDEPDGPRDTDGSGLDYGEGAPLGLDSSKTARNTRINRYAPQSTEEDETSTLFWRDLKMPLRWLLIALSGVAVILLLLSFLRSRKEDEEDDDDDEEDDAVDGDWPNLDRETLEFDWTRPREAIIGTYYTLQEDLRLTRNHRKIAQTPLEHGRQLLRFRATLRDALRTVVLLFYKALYGREEISSRDIEAFEKSCRMIKRTLR